MAPQPTQCFSLSRFSQETHIVLDDTSINVSEGTTPKPPSLVLVDWFTGGRIGVDEGPWSFDMFCGHINIVYSQNAQHRGGPIETLPTESQTFFRDTTILSGGEELRRHMRHFNVVCTILLLGPRTDETASNILKKFSSRRSYEDDRNCIGSSIHHSMNIGDGLNNDGILLSCGTFHRLIHGKVRNGTIMRIGAVSVEVAGTNTKKDS
jgi:urease accessory protein UreH